MNKIKSFGNAEGHSYAVNIAGVSRNFFERSFGQRLGDLRLIEEWKQSEGIKTHCVGTKHKASMSAVKIWIKLESPSEFYACWKSDSSIYKDGSVDIYYKN